MVISIRILLINIEETVIIINYFNRISEINIYLTLIN